MTCNNFGKKKRGMGCRDPLDELILSDNMSEDERFNAIILHYKTGQRKGECNSAFHRAKTALTIDDAIKIATAQNCEKRKEPHQYRIQDENLAKFCNNLLQKKYTFKSVVCFSDLHRIISECKVDGIGKLCIYDTANRIGAFLGIGPEKVYLHAGTKDGAEKLLGRRLKCDCISKADLPNTFQREDLSCAEIEDILCRYKKYF